MAVECGIVGELDLSSIGKYLTSIDFNSNTEVNQVGDELLIGPTIGNVNISGYAYKDSSDIPKGTKGAKGAYSSTNGGQASVSINYVQKYDCDNDMVYLLFAGAGESQVTGDIGGLAEIVDRAVEYDSVSASTESGPAQPYITSNRIDGYGLTYYGGPISFTTTVDSVFSVNISGEGFNLGEVFLKSFDLNYEPGTHPTASYSFIFAPNDNLIVLP